MEKYLQILKQYWGYDAFRPLQPEIITSIGSGKDTLGLMPTGGGKSLTFQVPALAADGVCIVVTPLIALMRDQVQNLRRRGITAAAVYSGLTFDEMNVALDNCIYGGCKFLYLSPERLSTELFLNKVVNMNVSMLVVDEAHCISQWGYDFRPSYLNIAQIRDVLVDVPVLALTATATPQVVADIMEKLRFRQPNVFQKSFSRSNLAYIVRRCDDKEHQMIEILRKMPGSAIVYVRNRRRTREYAEMLTGMGMSAACFHAGLSAEEKERVQNEWTANNIRIIVSTNAFGMGIDKPDVRIVIHLDAPNSLEAYFQEAGRAGRDGKKAYAVFLWSDIDARKLRKQVSDSFPKKEDIISVYNSLANSQTVGVDSGMGYSAEFDMNHFCHAFHKSITLVHNSLKLLNNAGYISYQEDLELMSRVMFTIGRDELFNVERQYPELDIVIRTILRMYTGLFTEYSIINEEDIAQRCGLSRQTVYERMLALNRMKVIDYNPQKKCTMITWTYNRVHERRLVLPPAVYADRLRDAQKRVESVIDYCSSTNKCRSRMLLEYFGEKSAEDCGKCDVCLERQRQQRRKETPCNIDEIQSIITSTLSSVPLPLEAICAAGKYDRSDYEEILRRMVDYGLVRRTDEGMYVKVEK